MLADEGDGRKDGNKKQEGKRHKNKAADFDRGREDGRFDSGLNSLPHDTSAVIGGLADGCIGAAAGRSLTIVQQSTEDKISETSFVFS